ASGRTPYRYALVAGIITHSLAFYWLTYTISQFGGFGTVATAGIFSLFVIVSSLQFILFVFLFRLSPHQMDRFGLRAPFCWVAAELCAIRIFPWHMGHTQIGLTPVVQIADLCGAVGVSFALFWFFGLLLQH